MATISKLTIGAVQGSNREVYAQWSFTKKVYKVVNGKKTKTKTTGLKEYLVRWEYYDGKRWYAGSDSTTSGGEQELKRVTYTPPENATQVRIKVKPVATTYKKKVTKKNKTSWVETLYWSGSWSSFVTYKMPSVDTTVPSAGTVSSIKISQLNGTSRTLLATWTWNKDGTSGYEVSWEYQVVTNGVWLAGSSSTVSIKNSTYDVPDNAYAVRIRIKPVAKDQNRWTADWITSSVYYSTALTPSVPSTPSISVDKYTLTASVNYTGPNAAQIEFEMVRDDSNSGKISKKGNVETQRAAQQFSLQAGHKYKVRCRAVNGVNISSWSDYSESVGASPAIPRNVSVKAISASSVQLTWTGDNYADSYTVEWTNKKMYFDSSPGNVHSESGITVPKAIITTGENGDTYFFRVKAVKSDSGESGWSNAVSVVTGKKPAIPTTWSLVTVGYVGEIIRLYWTHNSQDNSSQTVAQIELTVNGVKRTITVNNDRPEDEQDNISEYAYNTSSLSEGAVITWRVRTRGVHPDYSDWSIIRTIKVYAPPTMYFIFSDERRWFWDLFNFETDSVYTAVGVPAVYPEIITSLPINIYAKAGPDSQTALRYTVMITALEGYETEDEDGTTTWVKENDVVYESVVYPLESAKFKNNLLHTISAKDISLENNASYLLTCTAAMDSGLSASCSTEFQVGWTDDASEPDAEISIDEDAYAAYIMPYCLDDDGEYLDNILLSVYRRNFDGTFTEIAKDLLSGKRITVTDPHPALDYARYRIIAKSEETGQISYYDVPGVEYGEKALIIQWDEEWSNFETLEDSGEPVENSWSGSLLRLPYNIDVSESHSPDIELVEYIGREHPVSYFGTQKGETAVWNTEIDSEDKETLYALRRLKTYMGNCYVREPSGTGYWANVNVSISQKHKEVTIPVTLSVTRVEGGA